MKTLYDNLSKRCLLPVAALDAAGDAVQLAQALQRAGLPVLEISLTTPVALHCIEAIRSALPDFWVGAGTLLCSAQVQDALLAGARFGASPAMHMETIYSAHSADLPFIPGAMTPSEIESGIQMGCLLQKFHPAGAFGGIRMLQALVEPYRHTALAMIPSGGLQQFDVEGYLAEPLTAAVAGRFLCEPALIEAGLWEDLEAQAAMFVRKAALALRVRRNNAPRPLPLPSEPQELFR